jgi:asparagine synthase (glutamine-hydrolysing)
LIEQIWQQANPATARDGVRLVDLRLQLPDEFLHMTDRFSMAHSIEARTPFLDRHFAERMMRIPAAVRTDSATLKYLLIEAVKDLLPDGLISSPKRGFVLPVGRWLRTNLKPQVEHFLGPSYLKQQGIFEESIYEKLIKPHLEGTRDMSWQLWTLLMFQRWHEQYIRV